MERIFWSIIVLFSSLSTWARVPLADADIGNVIAEFQYENNYKEISSRLSGGAWDSCWIYSKVIEVEYPGMVQPLRVNMQHYIPNRNRLGETQVPAVIMIPPIGGMNMLDRRMAETFCDEKTSAVVLTDDFAYIDAQSKGSLRPPEDHHETYFRVGAAVKGSMAMIADDLNLDADKIGVFGVSLGGVLGSFMMSTQKEIAAGFFIVAGGDVPNILAYSQQDEVSRIRRKRMQAEGIQTNADYEAYLRQYILFDPLDTAKTMLPETLRMVISRNDTSVPTPNQLTLHEAFGRPEASYTNSSHVSTVISTLWGSSDRAAIARFFKQRFQVENPRPGVFDFFQHLYWAAAQ